MGLRIGGGVQDRDMWCLEALSRAGSHNLVSGSNVVLSLISLLNSKMPSNNDKITINHLVSEQLMKPISNSEDT
jgi:hypothetical protein